MKRVAFLGAGWIGRHRMEAMLGTGLVEAVAVADPSDDAASAALALAPRAQRVDGLDDILARAPDGIVIATPSALHAEQSIRALEAGIAIFCQKPLGRNGAEVEAVLDAARRADRLLGVDLSYRFTRAALAIKERVRAGALGRVYAASLIFHNGYGPDKAWFYDPRLSGGGCVMDLGVHLVDQALWMLDFPKVSEVSARLFTKGRPARADEIEDFATIRIDLADGAVVEIACSWCLNVGCDAVISAEYHGTDGGAAMRNLEGSFYDFVADHHRGTHSERLAEPPDAWGGGAACHWARQLEAGIGFEGTTQGLKETARLLDLIYAQRSGPAAEPRPVASRA